MGVSFTSNPSLKTLWGAERGIVYWANSTTKVSLVILPPLFVGGFLLLCLLNEVVDTSSSSFMGSFFSQELFALSHSLNNRSKKRELCWGSMPSDEPFGYCPPPSCSWQCLMHQRKSELHNFLVSLRTFLYSYMTRENLLTVVKNVVQSHT